MSQFFGSILSWKLDYHPSLWLSSISGAKIMSQKPKSDQNFYPYKKKPGLNNTQFGYGHNLPPE